MSSMSACNRPPDSSVPLNNTLISIREWSVN